MVVSNAIADVEVFDNFSEVLKLHLYILGDNLRLADRANQRLIHFAVLTHIYNIGH